jgi:hypothetical protein
VQDGCSEFPRLGELETELLLLTSMWWAQITTKLIESSLLTRQLAAQQLDVDYVVIHESEMLWRGVSWWLRFIHISIRGPQASKDPGKNTENAKDTRHYCISLAPKKKYHQINNIFDFMPTSINLPQSLRGHINSSATPDTLLTASLHVQYYENHRCPQIHSLTHIAAYSRLQRTRELTCLGRFSHFH